MAETTIESFPTNPNNVINIPGRTKIALMCGTDESDGVHFEKKRVIDLSFCENQNNMLYKMS